MNAVRSAAISLSCAACAVRALEVVALRMPIKPARSDSVAPHTKLIATRQPIDGSSRKITASAATKMATTLYSRRRKAMAPLRMKPDISVMRASSTGMLRFFIRNRAASKSDSTAAAKAT